MNYSLDNPPETMADSRQRRLWRRVRTHGRQAIRRARPAWGWLHINRRRIVRLIWLVSFAVALAFIAYRIMQNWQQISAYPWHLHLDRLLLGFGIYSINLLLTAGVWAAIIGHFSGRSALVADMQLFCLTNMANRLPTPLPFIGARTEAYAARGVARSATLTATAMEGIVTMLGAVVVAALTLPFGPYAATAATAGPLVWLVLLPLALLVLRPSWFMGSVNTILGWLKRPRLPVEVRPRGMLLWSGLFAAIWANSGLLYYVLATSIYQLAPDHVLVMMNVVAVSGIVGWLGQFLFFVPNLVLRQVLIAALLAPYVPFEVALTIALLVRFCVMIFELAWSLTFGMLAMRAIERDIGD